MPLAVPAILSGPSFALEVTQGLPTAVVVASRHASALERVQAELRGPTFRLYGSSDVVANDTNNCADTLVRDLQTGQTESASVTSPGAEQTTQWQVKCSYGTPTISDDGRFVGFSSAAWNLYPGATGSSDLGSDAPATHAYLRDRLLNTTELVDTPSAPDDEGWFNAISDDGRYVVFQCYCGDPCR